MVVNLRHLVAKLNETMYKVLEQAVAQCYALTHFDMRIEHCLLKLTELADSDFQRIAKHFELDRMRLTHELNRALDSMKTGSGRPPAIGTDLVQALTNGWLYGSVDRGAAKVRSGFVIIGILNDDSLSRMVLETCPEMHKISAATLDREFEVIMAGSPEDAGGTTAADAGTGAMRSLSVFVSFRRDDAALYGEYLAACLKAEIPGLRVVRESDVLLPGTLSEVKITEAVAGCNALLVVIGKKWARVKPAEAEAERDWVGLEIATGIRSNRLVIPCLVDGARMPGVSELGAEAAGFAEIEPMTLSERDLRRDTESLVKRFKNWKDGGK